MNIKLICISLLSLLSITINAQTTISGIWYRYDLFSDATLIIKDSKFRIKALHTAHEGEIDGDIIKIKDGVYYSIVEDPDYTDKCLLVFEENRDKIILTTYGENIGAGATVYYNGEYQRTKISDDENKELEYILKGKYDIKKIKSLLNDDIDYFIGCFEQINEYENNENFDYCISGFLPSAALYQKGILLIQNGIISILFFDCRTKPMIYQYYTTADNSDKISTILLNWAHQNGENEINRHYANSK